MTYIILVRAQTGEVYWVGDYDGPDEFQTFEAADKRAKETWGVGQVDSTYSIVPAPGQYGPSEFDVIVEFAKFEMGKLTAPPTPEEIALMFQQWRSTTLSVVYDRNAVMERCATIASGATLPASYQWSEDNRQKFRFGVLTAVAAIRDAKYKLP